MINLSATSPAQRWLVPVFFALIFVLGLGIYRDYGLSIDENQSRDNGMITLKYVGQMVAPAWIVNDHDFDKYNVPLAQYYDRDYGVAFETPVCLAERLLGYNDGGDKFLFRHLCTFLVCFGGLVAVFQLAKRRFRDWRLGLLAALWLLLSPRLFAEFFYNDKDAVFMALFAIGTNTGVRLLLRPTVSRAVWHAIICAITIDVRIMGVLLPMVTVAFLVWRAVRGEARWNRMAGLSGLYLLVLAGTVVALWPYLWLAPFDNFAAAFKKMSTFRWGGVVLYFGNFVAATDLPWHYTLVWIGITTPLLYVATGLLGLGLAMKNLLQQRWRLWHNDDGMQDILFLALAVGPLVAVIALHSVLYDGWRQVYFVYPAFLLLGIRGWTAAAQWRPRWPWWPRAVYTLTALSLLTTAAQMVHDHPLQNVYFNQLAGSNVGTQFELDYWGLGFRQDVEYIATHDDRPTVKIYAKSPSSADFNRLMLPQYQRDRLLFVENVDSADYFVTNYRWHPEPYSYPHEVQQVWADGRRVHSVFRLRW